MGGKAAHFVNHLFFLLAFFGSLLLFSFLPGFFSGSFFGCKKRSKVRQKQAHRDAHSDIEKRYVA